MTFHLRLFNGESDFPGMVVAIRASSEADGVESTVTAAELARGFQYLYNCNPSVDLAIAEVDGQIAGYTRVFWWDDPNHGRFYQSRAALHPQWRRQGIGTALLQWAEDRLGAIAAGQPEDLSRWFLSSSVPPKATGWHRLLQNAGYEVFRYYHALVRPHLEDIPLPPLPAGIELRAARPEHYRAIWKNVDDSSRDEWPYADLTEDDYQAWLTNPHFQPELWQIAWDVAQDVPVGHVLTFIDHAENEEYNRLRGYTEGIGVDPAWRRRGIARALICRSLLAQKAAGMKESALAADAGSSNEVTRLYEDCGFVIESTDTFYSKPFDLSPRLSE